MLTRLLNTRLPHARRAVTWLPVVSVLLSAVATSTADAQTRDCPPVLDKAKRLVLASAPDMNSERIELHLYVRDALGAAWRQLGKPRPAVIGRAGMAWGHTFRDYASPGEPLKREGDKRTPAGFFTIGSSFGFEPSSRVGKHVVLQKGETVCVDDVRSPAYNTIQNRSVIGPNVRGEDMRAISMYRHGLFIDYPSSRQDRAGSCIFLHLMTKSGRGTLGCLAMPEMTLLGLQTFAEPGAVLGVLAETARARFANCLPAPSD